MKLAFVALMLMSSLGFAQAIHVGKPGDPKVRVLAPGTKQGTQPAPAKPAQAAPTAPTATDASGASSASTSINRTTPSSQIKERLLVACPRPKSWRPAGNFEKATEWDIVPIGVNSKTYPDAGQAVHVGGDCDYITVQFHSDGSTSVNRSQCTNINTRNVNSTECLQLLGL